jgi:hypothetical protein
MINARMRMQTRARARARAVANPDINKCAFIAAIVSAALMLAVGLSFDNAIGPALAWLAR